MSPRAVVKITDPGVGCLLAQRQPQWVARLSGVESSWVNEAGRLCQAMPTSPSESCQKPVCSVTLKAGWVTLGHVKGLNEGNDWSNCPVVWLTGASLSLPPSFLPQPTPPAFFTEHLFGTDSWKAIMRRSSLHRCGHWPPCMAAPMACCVSGKSTVHQHAADSLMSW